MSVAEYEIYRRIKLLGEGAFGKAFLVECLKDGSQCVIKQVDLKKLPEQEQKETIKEAKILEALKHPNIVRFREVYKTKKGKLCIVMDFADGGDLSRRISNARGSYIPESTILDWFTQICLAIKHVHDRKILHRDLKCQNIFLTKNGIIKLGDFGIAKVLDSTRQNAKTMVGTPYYLSPEIIDNKSYNFKSDIWSLGVILYELCALKPPFDAESLPKLALKIVRGIYNPLPSQYSRELKNLVSMMLSLSPSKRPSVHQILKMPLITNRIKSYLSESVRLSEFSHTILHNRKFVDPKIKMNEIKQVLKEEPIPADQLRAQLLKERKEKEQFDRIEKDKIDRQRLEKERQEREKLERDRRDREKLEVEAKEKENWLFKKNNLQLPEVDRNRSPLIRNVVSPLNNNHQPFRMDILNQPKTPGCGGDGIIQRNRVFEDNRPKTPNYINRNDNNPFLKNEQQQQQQKKYDIKPIIYNDPKVVAGNKNNNNNNYFNRDVSPIRNILEQNKSPKYQQRPEKPIFDREEHKAAQQAQQIKATDPLDKYLKEQQQQQQQAQNMQKQQQQKEQEKMDIQKLIKENRRQRLQLQQKNEKRQHMIDPENLQKFDKFAEEKKKRDEEKRKREEERNKMKKDIDSKRETFKGQKKDLEVQVFVPKPNPQLNKKEEEKQAPPSPIIQEEKKENDIPTKQSIETSSDTDESDPKNLTFEEENMISMITEMQQIVDGKDEQNSQQFILDELNNENPKEQNQVQINFEEREDDLEEDENIEQQEQISLEQHQQQWPLAQSENKKSSQHQQSQPENCLRDISNQIDSKVNIKDSNKVLQEILTEKIGNEAYHKQSQLCTQYMQKVFNDTNLNADEDYFSQLKQFMNKKVEFNSCDENSTNLQYLPLILSKAIQDL